MGEAPSQAWASTAESIIPSPEGHHQRSVRGRCTGLLSGQASNLSAALGRVGKQWAPRCPLITEDSQEPSIPYFPKATDPSGV